MYFSNVAENEHNFIGRADQYNHKYSQSRSFITECAGYIIMGDNSDLINKIFVARILLL